MSKRLRLPWTTVRPVLSVRLITCEWVVPYLFDVIDLEFDRNLVEFPILRAMQAPSFSPCAGASSA